MQGAEISALQCAECFSAKGEWRFLSWFMISEE